MTTRFFLTTLFSIAMLFSLKAMDNYPASDQKTTFILLPLFESTESTIKLDKKYADFLAEVFRSNKLAGIYSNGSNDLNARLAPMSSFHSLPLQSFSDDQLSQSLFNIYTQHTGETVVIAADAKTLVRVMKMLSSNEDHSKLRSEDRFKVFRIESQQLGKGKTRVFDFENQLKASM